MAHTTVCKWRLSMTPCSCRHHSPPTTIGTVPLDNFAWFASSSVPDHPINEVCLTCTPPCPCFKLNDRFVAVKVIQRVCLCLHQQHPVASCSSCISVPMNCIIHMHALVRAPSYSQAGNSHKGEPDRCLSPTCETKVE